GAAQACLDETLRWTRDRQAFGHPISKFQGVSFPLVEAATHLRGARHVCYEALWRKDCALEHSAEAAMAKLWAPQLASRVIHQCLLTFGHIGYSTDSPIGQRLRDVIGLEIGDGTAQASSLVIEIGRASALECRRVLFRSEALWRKDCALEHSAEAAMAKLWAPQLASRVIHQCLLTFGHIGYSTDSPIGQRLRDVIGLEIGDGTAQASSLVI